MCTVSMLWTNIKQLYPDHNAQSKTEKRKNGLTARTCVIQVHKKPEYWAIFTPLQR
jgi:hypothetical protein